MRQVSVPVRLERAGGYREGVDPVSEITLALTSPAAGLDDVLPVDRQAELFLHGGFDVGLEPVYGAANGRLVFDELVRARFRFSYQVLDIDEAVLFGRDSLSRVCQRNCVSSLS